MTETIYEAIPVTYKGTQFRSKMEGRIARLLDNLKFTWEYEPISENGFTPDFKVNNGWIEAKYCLRGSDAEKIKKFAENHVIFIGGALPQRQYCKDWISLVRRMVAIAGEKCTGNNPYGFAPWCLNHEKGEPTCSEDVDMIMPVIFENGNSGVVSMPQAIQGKDIDIEKTLRAYYDATTYVFEAITEKQQETIEKLQEENKQLKKNGLKLKTKKDETKSARLSLLFKPSVKDGIKEIAWKHHLSFNDFIHQVCERILDGDIKID